MFTTLLLLSLLADPAASAPAAELPANYRDYFERAEAGWEKGLATREAAIEKAEVAHRGAPASQKATQRRKINDMKEELAEMKKAKPRGLLPANPKPGDIGITSYTEVYAVLDDKTLAVKTYHAQTASWALMKIDSTKGVKTTKATPTTKEQKPIQHHNVVFITAEPTPEQREQAAKFLPKVGTSLIVLETIKPAELAKMRALYEASK